MSKLRYWNLESQFDLDDEDVIIRVYIPLFPSPPSPSPIYPVPYSVPSSNTPLMNYSNSLRKLL